MLLDLADLLDDIGTSQDDDPTPCSEWDVAALRQHAIGWLTAFTDGYASSDGLCSDPESVTVEGRGGDQVRELARRPKQVLPEATSRPLYLGEAGMPGDMAPSMILWEYQMRGWYLARATGRPWSPADDGIEASLAFAPNMLTEDFQGEGKSFGPRVEIGDDAAAIDRLVALSGRDPAWSA